MKACVPSRLGASCGTLHPTGVASSDNGIVANEVLHWGLHLLTGGGAHVCCSRRRSGYT
jgi:hypothetical protein